MWNYLQKKYYDKKLIKNDQPQEEIKCGATEGALFIKQFVPNPINFIHLDVAASSFSKEGKFNGVPIKSLVNFIRRLK
jgi:leucyl aminopeptidase